MEKIDKIIKYFKELNEEGSPTMNTSTPNGSAGFSSYADASGPNAGVDSIIKFMRRKNKKIDYRSVPKKYKKWVKNIEK